MQFAVVFLQILFFIDLDAESIHILADRFPDHRCILTDPRRKHEAIQAVQRRNIRADIFLDIIYKNIQCQFCALVSFIRCLCKVTEIARNAADPCHAALFIQIIDAIKYRIILLRGKVFQHSGIDIFDENWKIYSRNSGMTGHKIGSNAVVENSMITDGCRIDGSIKHSILFSGVRVEKGAKIEDAVVMGKTVIKAGAVVEHCIVAENVVIGENAVVGSMPKGEEHGVATIGSGITIGKGAKIGPNAMVNKNVEDGEEQW